MRTIKFRGKTYDGVWVVGDLLQPKFFLKNKEKQHTKTWIVVSAFSNGGWLNIRQRYAVIPETVGQFTGLTDKNGKEIYEGDVLKVSLFKKTFQIVFAESEKWRASFQHKSHNSIFYLTKYFTDTSEVIGNIHDNPELL